MKKKHLKWLEFLRESSVSNFSLELLEEFDRQLKPQFEKYFQRPMNWERLWLFVEPVPEEFYLKNIETKEGVKWTSLEAWIRFGQMSIHCFISWKSKGECQFIHPSTKDIPKDIEVVLTWINDDTVLKDKYPGVENMPEMNKMDLGTTFDVFIEERYLTHEGFMEIYLADLSGESKVKDILNESLSLWNNHENQIYGAPENRGLFHQLDFEKREDNKLIFYLDCGSAIEGAHEFFMENLNKKFKGVEKVVFRAI